mmetsp:Transcript_8586/g.21067  ORF Transcript_8586/g.21067 Transcript_8586/m.21067 type:complete len:202 (-) Transcript_8586:161-766(-)
MELFHDKTLQMTSDEASVATMASASLIATTNTNEGLNDPIEGDPQVEPLWGFLFLTPVSAWTVFSLFIYAYVAIAFTANLIACYKFIATWNNIVKERRLDIKGFVQKQNRRLSVKEALRTHVTIDTMACKTCCICMEDFQENELVTQCDGVNGCSAWFHRKCLFTWLDSFDGCPCCRQDMLHKESKGMISNLVELLGFTEV